MMILSSHSVWIFSKWMISSIRSRVFWAPTAPEAFSISPTIRDLAEALSHFYQLDRLDHQLKWVVGARAQVFHVINICEGIRGPIEPYIRGMLIVLFLAACLVLSSMHISAAALRTDFSLWTSRFLRLICLARQNRPHMLDEVSLRFFCSAQDFSGWVTCLMTHLALWYSFLLLPFFHVS